MEREGGRKKVVRRRGDREVGREEMEREREGGELRRKKEKEKGGWERRKKREGLKYWKILGGTTLLGQGKRLTMLKVLICHLIDLVNVLFLFCKSVIS